MASIITVSMYGLRPVCWWQWAGPKGQRLINPQPPELVHRFWHSITWVISVTGCTVESEVWCERSNYSENHQNQNHFNFTSTRKCKFCSNLLHLNNFLIYNFSANLERNQRKPHFTVLSTVKLINKNHWKQFLKSQSCHAMLENVNSYSCPISSTDTKIF